MPDPAATVGVIGGAFAIVVALVAALVVVGQRQSVKSTLEIWQEENTAQAKKIARLEAEGAELRDEKKELELKLEILRTEVTGAAAISAFATEWRTHMQGQWQALKGINEGIDFIKDKLRRSPTQ